MTTPSTTDLTPAPSGDGNSLDRVLQTIQPPSPENVEPPQEGAPPAVDGETEGSPEASPEKFVLKEGEADREFTREELEDLVSQRSALERDREAVNEQFQQLATRNGLVAKLDQLSDAQRAAVAQVFSNPELVQQMLSRRQDEPGDEEGGLDDFLSEGNKSQSAQAVRHTHDELAQLKQVVESLAQREAVRVHAEQQETLKSEIERHMTSFSVFREGRGNPQVETAIEMAMNAVSNAVALDPQGADIRSLVAKAAGDMQIILRQAPAEPTTPGRANAAHMPARRTNLFGPIDRPTRKPNAADLTRRNGMPEMIEAAFRSAQGRR